MAAVYAMRGAEGFLGLATAQLAAEVCRCTLYGLFPIESVIWKPCMTEIYIKFLCAHYVLYGKRTAGAWGPVFGDGELVIDADANQGNRSYAKVGTGLHPVFACPPGVNGRTFLTGQTGAHKTRDRAAVRTTVAPRVKLRAALL